MLHLELLTDKAQRETTQMENAEYDSQIDNDDWEDMEIEDDMENMVDIYLFFPYKKVQNSPYSTGQLY